MAQPSSSTLPPRLVPETVVGHNGSTVTLRCFFCAIHILPNPLRDTHAECLKRSNLLKNLCLTFKLPNSHNHIPEYLSLNILPICQTCTAYLERLYRSHQIIYNAQKEANAAIVGLQRGVGDAMLLCSRYPMIRNTMDAHYFAPMRSFFIDGMLPRSSMNQSVKYVIVTKYTLFNSMFFLILAFCKCILFLQQQQNQQMAQQNFGRASPEIVVLDDEEPAPPQDVLVPEPPTEGSSPTSSGSVSSESGNSRVTRQTRQSVASLRGKGTRRSTRRGRN
ncbi:unnamed protein product [Orchesella dallaii]|uniref:ZAD domain-containing protein n=1 Tax=Orchesella dallaii TaxID=48710 RepID=A0ABP1QJZ8_9HEXA